MPSALADPDLSHIPGPRPRLPGEHTIRFVRDPYGFNLRKRAAHGEVFRSFALAQPQVVLHGADALEFVLMDREGLFSTREGWHPLEFLFSGGLMLRDFEDHRQHRRVMQTAFTAAAMRGHVARLGPERDRPLGGELAARPAIPLLRSRQGGGAARGQRGAASIAISDAP